MQVIKFFAEVIGGLLGLAVVAGSHRALNRPSLRIRKPVYATKQPRYYFQSEGRKVHVDVPEGGIVGVETRPRILRPIPKERPDAKTLRSFFMDEISDSRTES